MNTLHQHTPCDSVEALSLGLPQEGIVLSPEITRFRSEIMHHGARVRLGSAIPEIAALLHPLKGEDFILSAGTASGKTTLLSLLSLGLGFKHSSLFLPTNDAVNAVAPFLARCTGLPLGACVGFSNRDETIVQGSKYDSLPFIHVSNYGNANLREFRRSQWNKEPRLVIFDESHSPSDELLGTVAWIYEQKRQGAPIRIVFASATCMLEQIKATTGISKALVFNDYRPNVDVRVPSSSITKEAMQFLKQGKIVLILEPGVAECHDRMRKIRNACDGALQDVQFHVLHGGSSDREREKVLSLSPGHSGPVVIVATDTIQESVTLPIDVVLDCGQAKRPSSSGMGNRVICSEPVSEFEMVHRAGRAGRYPERGPGVYMSFAKATQSRPAVPIPTAERLPPVRLFLMASALGHSIDEDSKLVLLRRVPALKVAEARELSLAMNAITPKGALTPLGHALAVRPIDPEFGSLIEHVEKRFQMISSPTVSLSDARIAAADLAIILQSGGIVHRDGYAIRNWCRFTEGERDSDAIAQLKLWGNVRLFTQEQRNAASVNPTVFDRVERQRRDLLRHLDLPIRQVEVTEELKSLLMDSMLDLVGITFDVFAHFDGKWRKSDVEPPYAPYHIGVLDSSNTRELLVGIPLILGTHRVLASPGRYSKERFARVRPDYKIPEPSKLLPPVTPPSGPKKHLGKRDIFAAEFERSKRRVIAIEPEIISDEATLMQLKEELQLSRSTRALDATSVVCHCFRFDTLEDVQELVAAGTLSNLQREVIALSIAHRARIQFAPDSWSNVAILEFACTLAPQNEILIREYGRRVLRTLSKNDAPLSDGKRSILFNVLDLTRSSIEEILKRNGVDRNSIDDPDALPSVDRMYLGSHFFHLSQLYFLLAQEGEEGAYTRALAVRSALEYLSTWGISPQLTIQEVELALKSPTSLVNLPGDASRIREVKKALQFLAKIPHSSELSSFIPWSSSVGKV